MKTIFQLVPITSIVIVCFVLPVFLLGCAKGDVVNDDSGVVISDIANSEYGTVVMNESDSISLLGWIHFDEINNDTVNGQYIFETWGNQPYFPMFSVNTGSSFPEADFISDFTGQIFGDMVIIKMPLPGSTDSIGIVFDIQEGDELRGSVTLLPGMGFRGSIKALKKKVE